MKLINWNEDKEISPFEYNTWGELDYTYAEPTIKILTENDLKLHFELLDNLGEPIEEIGYNHSILYLSTVERVEHTYLIHEYGSTKPIRNLGDSVKNAAVYDESSSITAFITYPLSTVVEVTLTPLLMNGKSVGYPVGYVAWQVCKAYGVIYKSLWKEAGVGGHSLGDLYLSCIRLFKNNIIELGVDS